MATKTPKTPKTPKKPKKGVISRIVKAIFG